MGATGSPFYWCIGANEAWKNDFNLVENVGLLSSSKFGITDEYPRSIFLTQPLTIVHAMIFFPMMDKKKQHCKLGPRSDRGQDGVDVDAGLLRNAA